MPAGSFGPGSGRSTFLAAIEPAAVRRVKLAGLLVLDLALLAIGSRWIVQFASRGSGARAVAGGRVIEQPVVQGPPPRVPKVDESAPLRKGEGKPHRARVARAHPVAVHATPKAPREPPAPPPPSGPGAPALPTAVAAPDAAASEMARQTPVAPAAEGPSPAASEAAEEEGVRLVVHQHLREVEGCYERMLKQDGALQGVVELQFTVDADGSVRDAHAISNSTGSGELATCVGRNVQSWRFPRPSAGRVDFIYPFTFMKGS